MRGTDGWESRRAEFRRLLRTDWRKLPDSLTAQGMMIYDNPEGRELELKAVLKAGWTAPKCPLGLKANMLHQVYHLLRLYQHAKIDFGKLATIFEVGGGYGAMHCAVRSLGFSGKYYIHDFPELIEIQKLYAAECKIPAPIVCADLVDMPQVPDLAIALWSMSEMPISSRDAITDAISPKNWLIAYCDEFEGVDAKSWAETIAGDDRLDWSFLKCLDASNSYLFGAGK